MSSYHPFCQRLSIVVGIGLLFANFYTSTQRGFTYFHREHVSSSDVQSAEENSGIVQNMTINEKVNQESNEKLEPLLDITSHSYGIIDSEVDRKLSENRLRPIQYLPAYKNPCWYEKLNITEDTYKNSVYSTYLLPKSRIIHKSFRQMNTLYGKRFKKGLGWRMRCVPYFFIPGVSKCGTTDLYAALSEHPQVAEGPIKEPVYWNRIRWETVQYGIGLLPRTIHKISHIPNPKPFRDYVDLFDIAAEEIRTTTTSYVLANGKSEKLHNTITGDGTPSYMYDFDGWVKVPVNKGLDAPKFTIADSIHQINPNAKLIIIFREPADRLFSDYKYFANKKLAPGGKTSDDFHEKVVTGIKLMKLCLSIRSIRSCIYDRNLTLPSMPVRLRIGMYEPFLQDWFKVFPRENFYITRLEDYAEDKVKVLTDLHQFLGLKVIPIERNRKVRNQSKYAARLDRGMRNDTRAIITNFYREWNIKLTALLQDDRFMWNS